MAYVGVDWAKNGWVAVEWDGEEDWDADVYPAILNVWHAYEDADEPILVDIPIGLAEEGNRQCDQDARERLVGHRTHSVFWTPCRAAVAEPNLAEAKETNENRTPNSITRQAWGIVPRIREVDVFLAETPDARGRVRESHPEVCFAALDDEGQITDGKRDESGRNQRFAVLDSVVEDAEGVFDEFVRKMREEPPDGAPILNANSEDDLVDAMALAVTAKFCSDGKFEVLGGDRDDYHDDRGLPMEIVCPAPDGDDPFEES